MNKQTVEEILREVAKAGFSKSGEGYNAEYPFDDNNRPLPDCLNKEELNNFSQAIKQWAREKVGEDSKTLNPNARDGIADALILNKEDGYNQAKKEIRDRIEAE